MSSDLNDVSAIKITIYSTINKNDYARIVEVSPLYEVDITDYVISHSIDRQGELWENSIPIAGSASSSSSIVLDNTMRHFNPFYQSSLYGKYMKKDLKINVSTGWRIVKTDQLSVTSPLTVAMTTASNSLTVSDASGFLNGGSSDLFILKIDEGTANEEIVLCSSRTDKTVTIEERGYANTPVKSLSVGAVVSFDPYEYVNGGEFYVDEWSGGSDMSVNMKCIDTEDASYFTNNNIKVSMEELNTGQIVVYACPYSDESEESELIVFANGRTCEETLHELALFCKERFGE